MQPKHLNLQILSDKTDLQSFDCGDDDPDAVLSQ